MAGIPAASINGIDWSRIRREYPEAVPELEHLGAMLHAGQDSHAQFLRLCRLLVEVGESDHSEMLLRRNMDGAEAQELYDELHGSIAVEEFNTAIRALETQYSCKLRHVTDQDFLISAYDSEPDPTQHPPDDPIAELLSGGARVEVDYIRRGEIEAHLYPSRYADGKEPRFIEYTMDLRFIGGRWVRTR